MCAKLPDQLMTCRFVFCKYNDTGCITVNSMYNKDSCRPGCQVAAKQIQQIWSRRLRDWNSQQTRWFTDRDEVLVLIYDFVRFGWYGSLGISFGHKKRCMNQTVMRSSSASISRVSMSSGNLAELLIKTILASLVLPR